MKISAGGAALLMARRKAYAAFPTSPRLQKFVWPLPLPGAGIPVASKNSALYPGVDYYEMEIGSYRQQLHPGLPATGQRLYGYRSAGGSYAHLGGVVVAQKGRPVRMKVTNRLPSTHMLPFDNTIPSPGNGGTRQDRAAIHLHGGLIPWTSDGGPFHWCTPPDPITGDVTYGSSVVKWLPDRNGDLTDDYWYPNNQSARLMWYHDHAIGITRTNAYAGLASGYLINDTPTESSLGLPSIGVPLVFQDKTFWNPVNDPNYALYVPGAMPGDLWYPYMYDTAIFGKAAAPLPSAVPEFWADTMLVNGIPYPFFNTNAGMYRLRLLNACNARFVRLTFAMEHRNQPGEAQVNTKGLPVLAPVKVWQIGTEGGFLPAPVKLCDPATTPPNVGLVLGPGERADLIVDFSACAGSNVILYNDAPAPYPMGSWLFDYDLNNSKVAQIMKPGFGPNTRTLMKITVGATAGATIPIPAALPVEPALPIGVNVVKDAAGALSVVGEGSVYPVKHLTLNETMDAFGRLAQLIGTNVAVGPAAFGREYLNPTAGEAVNYGQVQIWNVYNLTADTHPMHVHLFNVKVLRRQLFDARRFTGTPVFLAPARGPEPGETGWKETIQMHPGECTTLLVYVENPLPGREVEVPGVTTAGLPTTYEGSLPTSPRLPGVDEYVWHCHILEHEEHDMMHALTAI